MITVNELSTNSTVPAVALKQLLDGFLHIVQIKTSRCISSVVRVPVQAALKSTYASGDKATSIRGCKTAATASETNGTCVSKLFLGRALKNVSTLPPGASFAKVPPGNHVLLGFKGAASQAWQLCVRGLDFKQKHKPTVESHNKKNREIAW